MKYLLISSILISVIVGEQDSPKRDIAWTKSKILRIFQKIIHGVLIENYQNKIAVV